MRFFRTAKTLSDITREYRRLSKIHHPDKGGDPETFKELTRQRDAAARALLKGKGMSDADIETTLSGDEWMEALTNFGLEKLSDIKNGNFMDSILAMADKSSKELLAGDEKDLLDENGNASFSKVASHVFKNIFGNAGKNLNAENKDQKKLNNGTE